MQFQGPCQYEFDLSLWIFLNIPRAIQIETSYIKLFFIPEHMKLPVVKEDLGISAGFLSPGNKILWWFSAWKGRLRSLIK